MHIQRKKTLVAVSFLAVVLSSGAAFAQMEPSIPTLSQAQVNQLNAGEVIIDVVPGEVPIGDAIGVINATPEQVMQIVQDFESYPEFMNDIVHAEVQGTEGDYLLCHGITDTPWPMDDREWVIRATGGPTTVDGLDVYLSTWDYVPGSGNVEDTTGYWLAIPWGSDGSQTLLRYRLRVDLGTWLPDFLLNWATENFLPNKITDFRGRVATLYGQ
ncbi:MAG: hypothetical protein KC561_05890 [Myxococcales bacterium]|nr:hypothetical protein [Myxococcales bacterium]